MSKELTSLSPTLLKELGKVNGYLEDLRDLAVKAGVNETGFTYTNALLALDKRLSQLNECEQVAKEQGYSTLAIAMKALGQIRKPLAVLPERIKYAPSHWVTEDTYRTETVLKNGKHTDKKVLVRGTSARTAQRLREGLEGMLQELWHQIDTDARLDAEGRETYKGEIVAAYEKEPYLEFSDSLLRALNGDDWHTTPEEETQEEAVENTPELTAELEEFRQNCEAAGVEYDEETARVLLKHH